MAKLENGLDPEIEKQAKAILNELGIPVPVAINMFYKQIILHKGLPFDMKLLNHPLEIKDMTSEQLNTELDIGYADIQAGRTRPSLEVFTDIHNKYGI